MISKAKQNESEHEVFAPETRNNINIWIFYGTFKATEKEKRHGHVYMRQRTLQNDIKLHVSVRFDCDKE